MKRPNVLAVRPNPQIFVGLNTQFVKK